jgi:hypothetical protein
MTALVSAGRKSRYKAITAAQISTGNALVFTDFQWVTLHMDGKFPDIRRLVTLHELLPEKPSPRKLRLTGLYTDPDELDRRGSGRFRPQANEPVETHRDEDEKDRV